MDRSVIAANAAVTWSVAMLRRFLTITFLSLGLAACGGTMPSASGSSGSSGSGITVYGDIDANVSHTR